jgi:tetratricopeptide (TPR) repeat protein
LGRYDEAREHLDRYLAENPNDAHGHVRYGEWHHAQHQYEQALERFNQAIRRYQTGEWWWYKRRADSLFRLERFDEALADLRMARKLKPHDLSTLVWIAPQAIADCPHKAFQEGMLDLAAEAVANSENPSGVRRARIPLYLALGERDKARADFAALLAPDNKQHYDHYTHALLCLMLQDQAKYRESCRTMLQRLGETDDPLAANFTAWTCALLPNAVDDYSTALALANKAAAAQPENQQFLNTPPTPGTSWR